MNPKYSKLLISIILFIVCSISFSQTDLNTLLMRSTYKITGGSTVGTCFILLEPDPINPDFAYYVLFTAAHVLDNIPGDSATVFLRVNEGNCYSKGPYTIQIRNGITPLWTKHPSVDIAAMRISFPSNADIMYVSTELLATDSLLEYFEIHPGDELCIIGYPYGQDSNDAGFPILRSGKIASFPLTPVGDNPHFFLDFEVFPANSGSPVYLWSENRIFQGGTNVGAVQMIMGIVTRRAEVELLQADSTIISENLALAEVVHAQYMLELLQLLPSLHSSD